MPPPSPAEVAKDSDVGTLDEYCKGFTGVRPSEKKAPAAPGSPTSAWRSRFPQCTQQQLEASRVGRFRCTACEARTSATFRDADPLHF